MTGRAKCLITLGRWVLVLTHVSQCATLVLFALMAAYSVASGGGRLQLDQPWESILFYFIDGCGDRPDDTKVLQVPGPC